MSLQQAIELYEAFTRKYDKFNSRTTFIALGLPSDTNTSGKLVFLNGPYTSKSGYIADSDRPTPERISSFINAAKYIAEEATDAEFTALTFNDPQEIIKYRACASFVLGELMCGQCSYWVGNFSINPKDPGATYYYRRATLFAQSIRIKHRIDNTMHIGYFPKDQQRLADYYHNCFVHPQSKDEGKTYLTLAQSLAELILEKGPGIFSLINNDDLLVNPAASKPNDEKAAANLNTEPAVATVSRKNQLIADIMKELFRRTDDYAGDLVHAIEKLGVDGADKTVSLLQNVDPAFLDDNAKKKILVNTLLYPTECCHPDRLNAAIDNYFHNWKAELNALVIATAKMRATKVGKLYENSWRAMRVAKKKALDAVIKALPVVSELSKTPVNPNTAAAAAATSATDHKSAAATLSPSAAVLPASAPTTPVDTKEFNFTETFAAIDAARTTPGVMDGKGKWSNSWLQIKDDDGQLIFPVEKITGSVTKDVLYGLHFALLRLDHQPPAARQTATPAVLPAVVTTGGAQSFPPTLLKPKGGIAGEVCMELSEVRANVKSIASPQA